VIVTAVRGDRVPTVRSDRESRRPGQGFMNNALDECAGMRLVSLLQASEVRAVHVALDSAALQHCGTFLIRPHAQAVSAKIALWIVRMAQFSTRPALRCRASRPASHTTSAVQARPSRCLPFHSKDMVTWDIKGACSWELLYSWGLQCGASISREVLQRNRYWLPSLTYRHDKL
jgi:hypothetical protein